jgi:uncharacterized membrane protein YeaQ/YmgE (transglycosylase-associated protein family)
MSDSTTTSWPLRIWRALISPRLTVVCLGFLIVLTFVGTVYQADHGLHQAKQRYFDSWIAYLGPMPFPGTQLVLAVLLANLLGYLLQMLTRERMPYGILLTHLGILLMLVGGAITQRFGMESHLSLVEGEASNVSASYNDWELAVWNTDMGVRDVRARDANRLRAGDVLEFPDPGLTVAVEAYHRNTRAFQDVLQNAPENRRGITHVEPAPLEKEPERNRPGAVLRLTWPGGETRRVLFFGEDAVENLVIGGKTYVLAQRHVRHPLPVLVTLKDFRREVHRGTEMARSFASKIEVEGEGLKRELTVSMNKPFRHRGLTFYQASFGSDGRGIEMSTFAVTRNHARLLPYIGTTIVVVGMMIHFCIMLVQRARRARTP